MQYPNLVINSLVAVFLLVTIAACGSAPHSQSTVIDEKSSIQISGPNLVGLTLSLQNGFRHTFSNEDLIKDVTRLKSIERSKDEQYQIVNIGVDSGEVRASIYRGAELINSKTFFVSKGTVYQWRIN